MAWLKDRMEGLPLAAWAFLGLIVALIPAGTVLILLEREARQERTEQLGQQAMRYARLLGQQQESVVESAQQVLGAMAAHAAIRSLRPSAECDAFLARMVAINQRYLTASVFDLEGLAICLAHEGTRDISVADQGCFQRVIAENSFQIGGFAIGRAIGERSLHFAAPLRNDAGQPVAVLLVALSLDWLSTELQGTPLPPGSAATIADRDGIILARSVEPERFIGQRMPAFALELLHAPAPGIINRPALDGVPRIAAYLPLTSPPLGLFISVGLESGPVLGAALYAERHATVMIVGSLLLTFALCIAVFHIMVERPVQRLLDTERSWQEGDWSARVGRLIGGREFRRLGKAFDTMAESVAAREAARLRAQTRMQAVVRVAPQIVLTADREGQVDWVNEHWRRITGLSLSASLGDGWLAAVHPDDREAAAAAWRAALALVGEGLETPFAQEMRVCHAAQHEWRWFFFTGAPIKAAEGEPIAWTAVGLDFHERRVAEANMAASAARLRATYDSAPAGLCLLDRDLRFVAINDMLAESNGQPAATHIGRTLAEMAPHVASLISPTMQQVLETGEPIQALELTVPRHGEERFWLCSCFPVFDAQHAVTGVSAAIIDITARKRIEASERMLSREVDHRAQNILSVVRGMIRLSAAESADDLPALVEVLEGRIAALSRVHNVLARERWVGADLDEIITQEFAAYPDRASFEGPPLRLTAEAAQPLTLVLHELVTNAAKYGALSLPLGRVALCWEIRQQKVMLQWAEHGGPEILGEPARTGLGSILIEANMAAQLDGRLERQWLREGLRCNLTIGEAAFAGGLPHDVAAGVDHLAGRRVLVADDQAERAALLVEALRDAGCTVFGPADTIESALAMLDGAGPLDAAVLPATLQGTSVQLLQQALRRRSAVILHMARTAAATPPIERADVLEEPITPSALREALRAALDRQRAVSANRDDGATQTAG